MYKLRYLHFIWKKYFTDTLDATVLLLLPLLFNKPGAIMSSHSDDVTNESEQDTPSKKKRKVCKKWNPSGQEIVSGFLHRVEVFTYVLFHYACT